MILLETEKLKKPASGAAGKDKVSKCKLNLSLYC